MMYERPVQRLSAIACRAKNSGYILQCDAKDHSDHLCHVLLNCFVKLNCLDPHLSIFPYPSLMPLGVPSTDSGALIGVRPLFPSVGIRIGCAGSTSADADCVEGTETPRRILSCGSSFEIDSPKLRKPTVNP